MSNSVNTQTPSTNVLITGRALTLTPGSSGTATITLSRGGTAVAGPLTISAAATFGPFNEDLDVSIIAATSAASYVLQDAPNNDAPAVEQFVTSTAAAATVGVGVNAVILDSVNSTAFALTFPVAVVDKQELMVQVAAATTTLTLTGSGDGSTIKNAPTALVAGTCFKYKYRAANTTWYREY